MSNATTNYLGYYRPIFRFIFAIYEKSIAVVHSNVFIRIIPIKEIYNKNNIRGVKFFINTLKPWMFAYIIYAIISINHIIYIKSEIVIFEDIINCLYQIDTFYIRDNHDS